MVANHASILWDREVAPYKPLAPIGITKYLLDINDINDQNFYITSLRKNFF